MGRARRRFWWSLGFAVGFIIRDLMEDESCVRNGLRKLWADARAHLKGCCAGAPAPVKECPKDAED